MLWIVPWLEVLGVLAIVFAAGNGIGFGLSWLLLRRGKRKTMKAAARPKPAAETMYQGLSTDTAPDPAPVTAYSEPGPVTTQATAAETFAAPEPEAEPVPAAEDEPEPVRPPEPLFQTISHRALTDFALHPTVKFGTAAITRLPEDQPSS
jgi:hypothetical protein